MSEPNLKAMTQAELLKYLEDDFMPRLLPKLANVKNLEAENARLKAEVERLKEEQKLTKLFPPIVESNAIPEGKAVLVDIYQHQQDAEEIKRLKAEVERLTQNTDKLCKHGDLEIERLKAEVAELKNQPDPLTAYLYAAELAKDEVKRLKAEVERLRQDLVAVKYYGELLEFLKANAAKEGKQP